MAHLSLISPVGELTIFEEDDKIISLDWGRAPEARITPLLMEAKTQLRFYFQKKLTEFDLPLAPAGTDFQQRVWRQMQAIPFGQTQTYGEIAEKINSGARPVGTACGRNPIPILIPCHRVVGAGGLGGYSGAGGLDTKKSLLAFEGIL
jgi:methylated-DNA-[protein]-cysteine S-methyltransferase